MPNATPTGSIERSLSIIIPAYNEESRLGGSLARLHTYLSHLNRPVEVIVIENGSVDGTAAVVREHQRSMPYLRLVQLSTPGKGGAVRQGMLEARGEYLMFCDADMSMPVQDIDLFLAELDRGAPIVIASRELATSTRHNEPWRRHLMGRAFNWITRSLVVRDFGDTQCGFKAFQRAVARDLFGRQRTRGWAFDVEILLLARQCGYRVQQIAINWYYDSDSRVDGMRDSIAMIVELARIRLQPRPSPRGAPTRSWTNERARADAGVAPRTTAQAETAGAKLRILALNWRCLQHPEAGGAEFSIFAQARLWVEAGHDVTIVTANPGRAYAPERDEVLDGIKVRRMGGRFTVYLYASLFVLRYGRRFDRILDIANGIPFFVPLFTRTPTMLYVHHVHDRQWFSEFSYALATVGWFMERAIVPLVYRHHMVVAVSPTTRDALIDTGFAPARVQVVYNGVRRPTPSRVSDARPGGPRIAYVGRLKRYKRLHLLLRAVAQLRRDIPTLQVDIIGDGDAKPELEALIAQLSLRECVTLHGYVDEQTRDRILRAATVFAMPSMHEGWGVSVIEANSCGCPAVAYDVPGLRVAIRHGDTGLLAADDDEFQAALALILRDPSVRNRLSANAVDWAARFSWEACARTMLRGLDLCHTPELAYSATIDTTILAATRPSPPPATTASTEAGNVLGRPKGTEVYTAADVDDAARTLSWALPWDVPSGVS